MNRKRSNIVRLDGTRFNAGPKLIYDDSIQFLRVMPEGMPLVIQRIRRSRETNMLAMRFIDSGGRYLVAIVEEDGVEYVRLCAMVGGHGQDGLILVENKVRNGPELLDAIDTMVRESLDHLDAVQ